MTDLPFYGQLPLTFLPGNFAAGHTWVQYPHQGTFAVGYDLIAEVPFDHDLEENWDWPGDTDTAARPDEA